MDIACVRHLEGARESKVRKLDAAARVDEHVLRLEVAVLRRSGMRSSEEM